jgi:hypothetical protein
LENWAAAVEVKLHIKRAADAAEEKAAAAAA